MSDVVIEPWDEGDLALLEQLNAPEMTAHLSGPEKPEKLADRQRRYELADSGMFKIMVAGQAVGSVGYWEREWRDALLSAAPCPAELELECEARLGCTVAQALGLTEGAPVTLPCRPVCHGSAGRLAPSTEAVVVDPVGGTPLGAGEIGELWVRGPQVMRGYLGDEVATLATIDADGWLHTGDLVRFDDDGNLFVVDRLKELIKVRGYHVAPAQLEAELAAHPAVADAAVVPRPDEESGEVPVAHVELRGAAEPAELAAWVAERVAPYKRLADVIVVDALPRAPSGKLLRRVLVEHERAAPVA